MKTAILLLTLIGSSAFATTSLRCENGPSDVKGDSHLAIEISSDKIAIENYESFLEVSRKDTKEQNSVITILPQKIERLVEGDVELVSISGKIAIGQNEQGVTTAAYELTMDGHTHIEALVCK